MVGNADYEVAPLRNPTNDAQDMAKALRELGFSVKLLENAPAVHHRHHEVETDHVGLVLGDALEGHSSVRRQDGPVAVALDSRAEQDEQVGVVVHGQHGGTLLR